jgi:dephospho-CoA kinase
MNRFFFKRKRKILNSCTHPYIRKEVLRQMLMLYLRGYGLIVFDAALLFESKWDKLVSSVILIYWQAHSFF